MRKFRLLALLGMMATLIIALTSCYGPQYCTPAYSTYYSYPGDYAVYYGPEFAQPFAYSPGGWSSYSRSGYFPVEYVPRRYGGPYNMVAILHDYGP